MTDASLKSLPRLDITDFVQFADRLRNACRPQCLAMYSSVLQGVVTDPALMAVPIDDRLVQRGDGVFEALRCVDGALYNLDAHLDRLQRSAEAIRCVWPVCRETLAQIAVETTRAGGEANCCVRIFVSRGRGTFGVRPPPDPAAQLYVAVIRWQSPPHADRPSGCRAITSRVPVKPGRQAAIKSCNYLPNVLMALEAQDAGADFAFAFDERGLLAEGATENAGIVTPESDLVFPDAARTLPGTTMLRVMQLAETPSAELRLRAVRRGGISCADLRDAREILAVGTTIDVVAVTAFDGRSVGDGQPGVWARELRRRLEDDMRRNPSLRTPVFPQAV